MEAARRNQQQQHQRASGRNSSVPSTRRRGGRMLRREHVLNPITALAFYTPSPPTSTSESRPPAGESNDRSTGHVSPNVTASVRARVLLAAEDTDLLIYEISASDEKSGDRGDHHDRTGGVASPSRVRDRQGSLLARIPIFKAQSIHGISVCDGDSDEEEDDDDLILIWGGYSAAVLSGRDLMPTRPTSSDDDCDVVFTELKAPDWIFDAKVSPFDRSRVALLTAHNEIVEAAVVDGTLNRDRAGNSSSKMLEMISVQSPSRPILYSGNIMWTSKDCVLVAAGTVFGEVLVWKWHCQQQQQPQQAHCEHLFAFSGHEGSIFGTHISPEIVVPETGETVRFLASCSDDRTVRVWDITERQGQEGDGTKRKGLAANVGAVPEARETGFRDNKNTNTTTGGAGGDASDIVTTAHADDYSTRRCVATAMGHISRIWHVEFVRPRREAPGIVPVFSFGEDSTAQKWHLCLGPAALEQTETTAGAGTRHKTAKKTVSTVGEASLTHKATFRNHTGKHIWSKAIFDIPGRDGVAIATGGSDGKIALVHDEDVSNNFRHNAAGSAWEAAYSLSDLDSLARNILDSPQEGLNQSTAETSEVQPAKGSKVKAPKESFQRYAFVSTNKLLVVTNQGRIFIGLFGKLLEWEQLPLPDELRLALSGYSVVESCLTTSTVFIGTSRGDIYAFTNAGESRLRLVARVQGKIADLFCLSGSQQQDFGVGRNDLGITKLLVTILGSSTATLLAIDSSSLAVQKSQPVGLTSGAVITAASLVGDRLILGSRNGAIFILAWDEKESSWVLGHSLKPNVYDAITSIVPLPARSGSKATYFLTTCRDGKYRIYETRTSALPSPDNTGNVGSQESLALLQETSPPFGPLMEKAWFITNPGTNATELMLCGFRSTHAVLWNATQQREVATVDCGGAHRSFAMTLLLLEHPKQPKRSQGGSQSPPLALADGFRFVFTKASQMHVFSQAQSQAQTVKPGSHGREIRAVASSGRYMATAAEDTVIRIHEYTAPHPPSPPHGATATRVPAPAPGGGSFRCVATIEKHATGIQTLRWYENEYLFSSGGNEEFFVWKVNRIDSDVCPLGIACEAVFADKSEVGDLRIMDFDVELLSPEMMGDVVEKKDKSARDGEGEMCHEGPVFCITMAMSNSTIQSYIYSRVKGFQLLGRRHYTGACLMQLRHLGFSSIQEGDPDHNGQEQPEQQQPRGRLEPHILTASTDGHLAVFVGVDPNLGIESENSELVEKDGADIVHNPNGRDWKDNALITRLHQSGIKSLDVVKVNVQHADNTTPKSSSSSSSSSSSFLVVTGGDDNAIGVMHLLFSAANGATGYTVGSKSILRFAHAAAITGIGIVRLENNDDGNTDSHHHHPRRHGDAIVVSTGNDQRVKKWRIVDWQQQAARDGAAVASGSGGSVSRSCNNTGTRILLEADEYSGVADSGDLEVIQAGGDSSGSNSSRGANEIDEGREEEEEEDDDDGKFIVGGVGMEVWQV